jgi:hypothetical protein
MTPQTAAAQIIASPLPMLPYSPIRMRPKMIDIR